MTVKYANVSPAVRAVNLGREFKAVFFDLDGTIVDIHGPLFSAARDALDKLGHQPALTRERYHEAISHGDVWLGLPENSREEYLKLAFGYFINELERIERMEVLPHVPETLAEIKRRGYATAVITSRPGDSGRLAQKLAIVGLASYFDQVVTQDTASFRALDKTESLRRAAEHAGIAPSGCVYVGDEPRDVMAASAASYGASIAVATGPASYQYLLDHPQHRPDFVMRSMGELPVVLDRLNAGAVKDR